MEDFFDLVGADRGKRCEKCGRTAEFWFDEFPLAGRQGVIVRYFRADCGMFRTYLNGVPTQASDMSDCPLLEKACWDEQD